MLRFFIIFLAASWTFCANAAKLDDLPAPQGRTELYGLNSPVTQVQNLLKTLGRYHGRIDGFMGSDLERAIRLYEKEHGLTQTGRVSHELIIHLDHVGRIRALINRLEDVRHNRREAARQALLSDPRTRNLLQQKDRKAADPTLDQSRCLKKPDSTCLLRAAVETSRAIYENDMRDWALGEILAAQVSVGQEEDALKTAARIKDSRLIIAALTNIAKTHARDGKIEEALSSLDLIPLTERRLSVLLEIAGFYRNKNRLIDLDQVLHNIVAGADGLGSVKESLSIQINAARLLASVDKKRALNVLNQLSQQVVIATQDGVQNSLMRQIADTIAKIGYPEQALQAIEKLPDDNTRIPVLMAASRSFAHLSRFDEAKKTIKQIHAKRYRSVALSDLATTLWEGRQQIEALDLLEQAVVIAKKVHLPFARNFALSHIAHSLIKIVTTTQEPQHAERALNVLHHISDARLKARGLWNLAHATRQSRVQIDQAQYDKTATSAMQAVKSSFSRAWILGDLVEYYQGIGDQTQAKRAFNLGLNTVKKLKNPWARSRALAKFATLAHRFD